MRGAHNVTISLKQGARGPVELRFFEIPWRMTPAIATVLVVLCVAHLVATQRMMKSVGHLFGNVEFDDDYRPLVSEKERKFYLKYGVRAALHNLDLVSDVLYYATVPAFSLLIKRALLAFLLLPIIFFMLLWLNEKVRGR